MNVYQHYKGDLYQVICTAENITDRERPADVVVYRQLKSARVFCRPKSEFHEIIEWPDGKWRARFDCLWNDSQP